MQNGKESTRDMDIKPVLRNTERFASVRIFGMSLFAFVIRRSIVEWNVVVFIAFALSLEDTD